MHIYHHRPRYSPDSFFCKTCDEYCWRRLLEEDGVRCGCCKNKVRFAPRGANSFQAKGMVARVEEVEMVMVAV